MTAHLFFYGVLIAEIAPPPVQELLAGLGPGRPAIAQGDLFAVVNPADAHPAMVPGEGEVKGVLHEAGTVDLAGLDVFEGADYCRQQVSVSCAGETVAADAYVWVGSTAGLEPIADGDFARWLAESGLAPIGH